MSTAIRPDFVSKELESDLDNSNLYSLPVGNGEIKGATGSTRRTPGEIACQVFSFSGWRPVHL